MEIKVQIENSNQRIDNFLPNILELSRSKVSKMIQNEKILVNNQKTKNSYLLKENDIITTSEYEEEPMNLEPMNMNLDIVFEDDDVIVVNKKNGVVVHPAVGNKTNTLVNGLLYHSKSLSNISGEFRPGIVHRIDAYTTGLLMVAKNNKAHEVLAKELEEKKTTRKYIALVWGVIKEETGTIDAPIGRDKVDRKKMSVTDVNAKEAVTHFKVIERYKNATLIELQLETGRTHQIRVHMNYIGHPVVNDPFYGYRRMDFPIEGQALHSKSLDVKHPITGEAMHFEAPLPDDFKACLEFAKTYREDKRR